jgi:hypothetical protein
MRIMANRRDVQPLDLHPMKRLLAAIALCVLFAGPAAADVVGVSNLAETPVVGALVENIDSARDGNFNRSVAQMFVTGADEGYSLTSVTIRAGDALINNGNFTLSLMGGPKGSPVFTVAALDGSATPTPAGLFSYAPSSPVLLTPSTAYWIVAEVPVGAVQTGYLWSATDSVAATGLPGWTMGQMMGRLRISGGAAPWNPDASGFRALMEIGVVAAVPEASPLALFLVVGSAAIAWSAMKRGAIGAQRLDASSAR